MLVLGLHAVYAHVVLRGVNRRALSDLRHALRGPRSGRQRVFMDEVSARCDLKRIDIAAEFEVLRPPCACLLDLLLALRRPHVEVLNG